MNGSGWALKAAVVMLVGATVVAGSAKAEAREWHGWNRSDRWDRGDRGSRGDRWGRDDHDDRWRDRNRHLVVVLPALSTRLIVRGHEFFYRRGTYYEHCSDGYVVIPAPIGAVVSSLPESHRTLVIDGVIYHEYDGVYYKGGPAGYTVVQIDPAAPGVKLASAVTVSPVRSISIGQPAIARASAGEAAANETLVVNVPNRNGSYTPVELEPAVHGMYIGPQGEVYPNKPDVAQLQDMYGK